MTAQELKENGQKLFKAQQYAEAMPLLKSATEAFPKDEQLWQELVFAASCNGQHEQAAEFAKQAIRQHPRSDWLWGWLGSELTVIGQLDKAEKALNNARSLNPNADWLWRCLAALHRKHKNLEKEIEALENLDALGEANATDLWYLGLAYYSQRDFAKAIESYRLSAQISPDPALLSNLGLVFKDPEVSQDADAADAYRHALALKPDYDLAREQLDAMKRKLVPLAAQARTTAMGLVQLDEHFRFYISPFEALQIGQIESVEELDVKAIQRAKKRLLQEIDLNDGKVSWLDDQTLDKSRALALEDELQDEVKCRYHWAIFQNKRVLRFLTRGDIEHFLYSDGYFPQETLALLDEELEFRSFLSKPFARQYNFVLTRAIERRLLPVVEVLFDGRRWVEPRDEDICFEGILKRMHALVEQMTSMAEKAKTTKVDVSTIERFLDEKAAVDIFNLLPTAFRGEQSRLVAAIRSLAIACHNEHGDSESSAEILDLCKRFHFKSAALNRQLEEDSKAIQEILSEQRKHSFSACIQRDLALSISHSGIRFGAMAIEPQELESVRWGVFIQTVNGVETDRSFSLVVRGQRVSIPVEWGKRSIIAVTKNFFRKPGETVPVAEMHSTEQGIMFQKAVDAVLHNLVPALLTKLVERLVNGNSFAIGPCVLSRAGIAFRTGLLFRKDHLVPWSDAETQMRDGQMSVFSKTNRKAQTSMAIRDTDNAVVLPILCAMMVSAASQPPPLPG